MRILPMHSGSKTTGLRRSAPIAAAAVTLLALAATGCGNGDGGMASTASQSSAPSATGAGSAPATTGSAQGGAPAGTGPAASGAPQSAPNGGAVARAAGNRCTVTELRMRLGAASPGAGQVYYPLRFTNTSGRTCELNGFPGVSLLRGDGSVIGKPASREGAAGGAVKLAPGATVEADLHTVDKGITGGGCWRTPTLLKAYPPGSRDAMTLATKAPVICGDTFDVGTVH